MTKFLLTITISLLLLSTTSMAQTVERVVKTPETKGQTIQNVVSKTIGDYYIQVISLQTDINELKEELDKCHKDGCKIEPPKSK